MADASDAFKMSDVPLAASEQDNALPRLFENEEQYGGDVLAGFKRAAFGRRAG